MRSAETVLTIIRERGQRGLPLEDVYRMLYNPDLYLLLTPMYNWLFQLFGEANVIVF